jgi:hypothetical protein
MNVGYGAINQANESCKLCGADIYINKLGTDYKCMNPECILNEHHALELIKLVSSVLIKNE